jgi:hypothetical protein
MAANWINALIMFSCEYAMHLESVFGTHRLQIIASGYIVSEEDTEVKRFQRDSSLNCLAFLMAWAWVSLLK